MSIQLLPDEQTLRTEIEERVTKARDVFEQGRIDDEVGDWIMEAGERAHRLHVALKNRGHEPRHHGYMIRNRALQPDDPEFYMHFHPLEDLLKFLNDEHANDDPVDQTIGSKFTFRVYSNRWGHEDTYRVQRTADGWTISYLTIGGPCDKGGRPFLFENFRQDTIHFPDGLDLRLEWLWNQASERGLSVEQVQDGLQQLADWVSTTERNVPSDGIWEGY